MSEENVEIVRCVYDATARRDSAGVLAVYDPEVAWDNSRGVLGGGLMGRRLYRGHEGLRRFFAEWFEAWETVEFDLEELIEVGDQVISIQSTQGCGRASGIEVDVRDQVGLWTLRNGKIVRVSWFPTRAEALEAAGVQE